MTSSVRFPVPVRSAVKTNFTNWCCQTLSERALNAVTVPASTTGLGKLFQICVQKNLSAFLGHLQCTTVDSQADVSREWRFDARWNATTSSTTHESTPVYVGSTTTSTPDWNFWKRRATWNKAAAICIRIRTATQLTMTKQQWLKW